MLLILFASRHRWFYCTSTLNGCMVLFHMANSIDMVLLPRNRNVFELVSPTLGLINVDSTTSEPSKIKVIYRWGNTLPASSYLYGERVNYLYYILLLDNLDSDENWFGTFWIYFGVAPEPTLCKVLRLQCCTFESWWQMIWCSKECKVLLHFLLYVFLFSYFLWKRFKFQCISRKM